MLFLYQHCFRINISPSISKRCHILSFLLDKINEISNKNLLTEIEYRIYLELLLIKHLNTTQKDYIENKSFIEIKGETIKSNQENKSEGLFNENSWEKFLNYLKKF